MVKLALAVAVAVAAPGFCAAATCPFFRAVVENERLVGLNLLNPDCEERPSSGRRSKSRRYVPCTREGDPIMVEHFEQSGCVGALRGVFTESPGNCTARITQVYQANDKNENHCAAFFADTSKMPLNQATVSPKVSYYAPGQCRKFLSSVVIDDVEDTTVGAASSGSWACNADGSVTHRKFASPDCTGVSIATTLFKSPSSGCIEPTSIQDAEILFGACVSVCATDGGGALPPSGPPSGPPSTVPLPPSQSPSLPGTGVVSPGASPNQSSSGGSLAMPLVLPICIAARLLALLSR